MNWAAKKRMESANGRGLEMLEALCLGERKKQMHSDWDSYDPQEASNAWPPMNYEGVIEKVEEKRSKKTDDPMLDVHIKVFNKAGETQMLHEYITRPPADSGRKGSLFKLRQIAAAIGMEEKFRQGALRPRELVGKNVMVMLKVESNPQFGDQNKVDYYEPVNRTSAAKPDDDDEVPF